VSADGTTASVPEGAVSYKDRLKRFAHAAVDPLVGGLARLGVKPDHLTLLGFGLSLGTALAFALGHFRTGALIACFSGVCDILDGQIARRTGTVTRFGAFFDSTLDRVAEAAMLLGIAWFYVFNLVDMAGNPSRVLVNLQNGLEPVTWGILGLLAMLALVGSFMVSYTRARAEGLGIDCKVGWFERPERMIVLILAGFAGLGPVLSGALLLLTVLSFATAIQRMIHVWKVTRTTGSDSTEA
jgi:CDP-diacylglycerol--glycerol-3-phosphate 3-phosphatidyltransferase